MPLPPHSIRIKVHLWAQEDVTEFVQDSAGRDDFDLEIFPVGRWGGHETRLIIAHPDYISEWDLRKFYLDSFRESLKLNLIPGWTIACGRCGHETLISCHQHGEKIKVMTVAKAHNLRLKTFERLLGRIEGVIQAGDLIPENQSVLEDALKRFEDLGIADDLD